MDGVSFDIAHMLAGGLVLVSFMLLYQQRIFALLNVFALHALVLSASVAWMDSFVNCTIGHGSMSPQGLMWCEMPVAAGQRACPSPS